MLNYYFSDSLKDGLGIPNSFATNNINIKSIVFDYGLKDLSLNDKAFNTKTI